MRILTLISHATESDPVLRTAAKLGVNLWAHMVLLTVLPENTMDNGSLDPAIRDELAAARRIFLEHCGPHSPFSGQASSQPVVRIAPGRFEMPSIREHGQKELKLLVRYGDLAREILDQASEEEADLIIMSPPRMDLWSCEKPPPLLEVAAEADCSTLIIKDLLQVENIIVGLENPNLKQTAREMFAQITTIFNAPAAMYPLPSSDRSASDLKTAMGKLIKIFKAHDLNIITAEGASAQPTICQLYNKARHNMLILR